MTGSPSQILITLIAIMRQKAYQVFERPFELNIIGLRGNGQLSGKFDDEIFVFYKNLQGAWIINVFKATTDPGMYWLNNPLYKQGTALLKEGQYLKSYAVGLHRNKIPALVQVNPVTIYRVVKRGKGWSAGNPVTGNFGINIHPASVKQNALEVGPDSAGCQVIASPTQFPQFLALAKEHSRRYGYISYTLIDFRDYNSVSGKLAIMAMLGFGLYVVWAMQKINKSQVHSDNTDQELGSLKGFIRSELSGILESMIK